MTENVKFKVGQSDLTCRNGCGFFGNPEWSWYCSQCWRKQNSNIQAYTFDAAPSSVSGQGGAGLGVSPGSLLPSSHTSPSPGSMLGGGSAFSPSPSSHSQSLPSPLNKERMSFTSMLGKSPGLDRKLKLPSPQHITAGISNKTRRLHSQTLERGGSIRQIFNKGQSKKDEKQDKLEPVTAEVKAISKEFGEFVSARTRRQGMADLSRNIQSFVEKVNKRIEILPIEEVAAMVQNFYQALWKRLETHENFQGLEEGDIKTISDYTERYIMVSLYKKLFSPVSTNDEEKDLEIQSKIRSLNWVTASHLDCPFTESSPTIRDLIYTAINHVLEVDGLKAPQDKLTSIVACSKTIFSILSAGGTEAASADDFLPALIYILLKANPPRVTSNINLITRFTDERRLRSGEEGYYFTNLCCAISFIENLNARSLNLPEKEFQLYMSGESLPPGSWETSLLMCEGIQTMTQNLKTLTELSEAQEKLIRDAETLHKEMEDWQTTFAAEVEAVLVKTQYTIRGPKKAVAVDSDVQDSLDLPPPILPHPVQSTLPEKPSSQPGTNTLSPDDPSSLQSDLALSRPNIPTFQLGGGQTELSAFESPLSSLAEAGPPSFLDGEGPRSLIDQTPTEEMLTTPLLPAIDESVPVPSPQHHVTPAAAVSAPLSDYVGFSAQAFAIPSISCSTAESSAPNSPQKVEN